MQIAGDVSKCDSATYRIGWRPVAHSQFSGGFCAEKRSDDSLRAWSHAAYFEADRPFRVDHISSYPALLVAVESLHHFRVALLCALSFCQGVFG
jgi:hypothetical protein